MRYLQHLAVALVIMCSFLLVSSTESSWPTNYNVVSDDLSRSGQPDRKEMKQLEKMGVKTILNLRYRINNKWELKKTGLKEVRLKLKAQDLSFEDMVNALTMIRDAEKPVLVHCLHGSDRTGCVVACYRMVFQGWSREKAIEEFQLEEFGYNYRWFPNILTFLQNVDVFALKKSVILE